MNTYAYVGGNPLIYVDPTGEVPVVAVTGTVGAIIGGVSGAISGAQNGGGFSGAATGAVRGIFTGAISGVLAGVGFGGPLRTVTTLRGTTGSTIGGVLSGIGGTFIGLAITSIDFIGQAIGDDKIPNKPVCE